MHPAVREALLKLYRARQTGAVFLTPDGARRARHDRTFQPARIVAAGTAYAIRVHMIASV
jgi:hypothetical protein